MRYLLLFIVTSFFSGCGNGESEASNYLQPRLFLQGHTDIVHSVALFRDGSRAVTGSIDGTVRIWELIGGNELKKMDQGNRVLSVSVAPDGQRVISGGSGDEGIFVWDVDTGLLITKVRTHLGGVVFVAYSPDGRFIASAGVDEIVRLWNATDLTLIGELRGHSDFVLCLSFSHDSEKLYSCSGDRSIRVWSVPAGTNLAVWEGHEASVRWISLSKDDSRAVSASYDGSVRIWDTSDGQELISWRPGGEIITVAEFLPDDRLLIASRSTGPQLWDKPNVLPIINLQGHKKFVESIAVSLDGKLAVSASWDNTSAVWDLPPAR